MRDHATAHVFRRCRLKDDVTTNCFAGEEAKQAIRLREPNPLLAAHENLHVLDRPRTVRLRRIALISWSGASTVGPPSKMSM